MKMKGKNTFCISTGMLCMAAISLTFIVVAPLKQQMPNRPMISRAEPPISISVSFMAAYSLAPLPQTPINKYIGISATSQNMNMVNMSVQMKKPQTPVERRVNHRKYSLVRGFSCQEANVPVKTMMSAVCVLLLWGRGALLSEPGVTHRGDFRTCQICPTNPNF